MLPLMQHPGDKPTITFTVAHLGFMKTAIRYISVKATAYLRAEDIVEYLREIANSEETDTRNRLMDAANSLLNIGSSR